MMAARADARLTSMATSMMVFTRDLRVHDNPALAAAAGPGAPVVTAFIIDDAVIGRYSSHANRLAFLTESLADLDGGLRARGSALVVRRGQWVQTAIALAKQTRATSVHVAADYSSYAQLRLAALRGAAAAERIEVIAHPGVTVSEPGSLTPAGGRAYQVFGAYYRRWEREARRPLAEPAGAIRLPAGLETGSLPELRDLTAASPAPGRLPGGEQQALARLRAWASAGLPGYATGRDQLAADAVSRLSPYLHLGCLSPRTVVAELAGQPGSEEFLRQIAWRDFFHQALADRPATAWQDYRPRADSWRIDTAAFAAWQEGRTGYPVVDAAMRQLADEGFLHNRARMIVASFLTKDLYLDWRLGADYFMRQLSDGDIACNQLNWQWVAGTGTDTNPSRIFSPVRQGERFDPDGAYVRRYLPELSSLPAGQIHWPDDAVRRACRYPAPLVDHRTAIAEYRARIRKL
jgi:deoxyribodipyrimidine photo-lyase